MPRFYAIVLLTAPVLILLTLLALSMLSSTFAPAIISKGDTFAVLALWLGVGILGGGVLEAPNWTGFVTWERRHRLVARGHGRSCNRYTPTCQSHGVLTVHTCSGRNRGATGG